MSDAPEEIVIQSHRGPYRVRFGAPFFGLEKGLAPEEHLLIDAKVAALYEKPLAAALRSSSVLRIEATEENKSLERLPAYIEHLLDRGVRRDHTLVAVGGGILQDIAAFLAAVLHRGLSWRFYPTTLLAQADSCIGSKSSVNVAGYKNQLGTFTPPCEIWIAPELLGTLTRDEIRSGIGEMIKVHILAGWGDTRGIASDYPHLFENAGVLLKRIRRSLEIKKEKIERDEFDRNERLVMNYGHSFGHAIESATRFKIPHGIAVTIGLDMANFISWRFGFIEEKVFDELHALCAANYSGFEEVEIPEEAFWRSLGRDKKNVDGDVTLILMRGAGKVFKERYPNDDHLRGLCREFWKSVFLKKEAPCPTL